MAVRKPISPVRSGIHTDIPSQFPAIYREDGALFVEFTKAYYEWLDDQPGNTREAFLAKDIDQTYGDFLVYYKNTYLNGLPFTDEESVRFAIKHIQDLYRRKGSEESLRLFFRLFFDEEIEVFYPSYAMLRASDSIWKIQKYLELKPVLTTEDYPIRKGDRIFGDNSRAEAYVDELVFRNFRGALTPIAFLSNIYGSFLSDDGLTIRRNVNGETQTIKVGRLIYGSIDQANIQREKREPENQLGDRVKLVSQRYGFEAKGVVSEIAKTTTGIIDFFIKDGGWGYALGNTDRETLVSNQVIMLNPKGNEITFTDYDEILVLDAEIRNTRPNDNTTYTETVSGYGRVNWIDKETNVIHLITTANSAFDNLTSFDPYEFTGKFGQVTFNTSDIYADFAAVSSGTINSSSTGNDAFIYNFWTEVVNGYARADFTRNGAITHIGGFTDLSLLTDYFNGDPILDGYRETIENNFINFLKNNVNAPSVVNTYIRDRYLSISNAVDFDVVLTRTFNNSASYLTSSINDTETVSVITDIIGQFVDVNIGDADYGMSGSVIGSEPVTNANTAFKDAFEFEPLTIGAISNISVIDDGLDYTFDVKSKVIQNEITSYDNYDVGIMFDRNDFVLVPGDIITQEAIIGDFGYHTNFTAWQSATTYQVGDVVSYEDNYYTCTTQHTSGTSFEAVNWSQRNDGYTVRAEYLRTDGNYHYFRMRSFYGFDNDIKVLIQNNQYDIIDIKKDLTSKRMGENADIPGEAFFATGQIEKITVTETGYRYRNGERVDIINIEPYHYINGQKVDNPKYNVKVAEAIITTSGTGFLEGKWTTPTSFLSDEGKVLQDNNYYQEYSYDVSSLIKANRYEELLKDKIGVAGTKLFSSTLINSLNNFEVDDEVIMEIWNLETVDLYTEDGNQIGIEEPQVIGGVTQTDPEGNVVTIIRDTLGAVLSSIDQDASDTLTQDIND